MGSPGARFPDTWWKKHGALGLPSEKGASLPGGWLEETDQLPLSQGHRLQRGPDRVGTGRDTLPVRALGGSDGGLVPIRRSPTQGGFKTGGPGPRRGSPTAGGAYSLGAGASRGEPHMLGFRRLRLGRVGPCQREADDGAGMG